MLSATTPSRINPVKQDDLSTVELLGTKVLGLDGDGVDASAEATSGSETTMYLPEPEPTEVMPTRRPPRGRPRSA